MSLPPTPSLPIHPRREVLPLFFFEQQQQPHHSLVSIPLSPSPSSRSPSYDFDSDPSLYSSPSSSILATSTFSLLMRSSLAGHHQPPPPPWQQSDAHPRQQPWPVECPLGGDEDEGVRLGRGGWGGGVCCEGEGALRGLGGGDWDPDPAPHQTSGDSWQPPRSELERVGAGVRLLQASAACLASSQLARWSEGGGGSVGGTRALQGDAGGDGVSGSDEAAGSRQQQQDPCSLGCTYSVTSSSVLGSVHCRMLTPAGCSPHSLPPVGPLPLPLSLPLPLLLQGMGEFASLALAMEATVASSRGTGSGRSSSSSSSHAVGSGSGSGTANARGRDSGNSGKAVGASWGPVAAMLPNPPSPPAPFVAASETTPGLQPQQQPLQGPQPHARAPVALTSSILGAVWRSGSGSRGGGEEGGGGMKQLGSSSHRSYKDGVVSNVQNPVHISSLAALGDDQDRNRVQSSVQPATAIVGSAVDDLTAGSQQYADGGVWGRSYEAGQQVLGFPIIYDYVQTQRSNTSQDKVTC